MGGRAEDATWLTTFEVTDQASLLCKTCKECVPVGMYVLTEEKRWIDMKDTTLSAYYHCALGHWIEHNVADYE